MSSKSAASIRLFVSKTLLSMAFASAALAAMAQVNVSSAKVPEPKLSVPASVSGQAVDTAKMSATFSRLPLAFEANGGQLDPRVKFISRGSGYNLFLTGNEAVLALAPDKSGKGGDVIRLKIAGANSKAPVSGLEVLPGKTNYFIGKDPAKWRTNIANYSKVRYANVYRGIDLVYYGNQQQLEHDFVVAPGADPNKIALQVTGAQMLHVDAAGDLVLKTKGGELRFKKPLIYQEKNGTRVEIAGGYQIEKQNRVSFQVGDYDHTRELTIDPVLNYSTYLSASSSVSASAIAVDSSGNAYITGTIAATGTTPFVPVAFPPTSAAGCFLTSNTNDCTLPVAFGEVFVAKLNATGTALTFLSIIGGSGADTGNAVAIDTANPPAVYVTGQTSSTDFPTTAGAFNTTAGNNAPDAYAFKLQSDGAALLYSTYLNGGAAATDHADNGTGIAVGPNGNIYVTGSTASTTFLPALFVKGIQTANGDGTGATTDAFLVKLNPAGGGASDLQYGTYYGGATNDVANAIALQTNDKVYIAGFTTGSFPTVSPVQAALSGTQDGFVVNLATNAAIISTATCIHGTTANTVEFVTATAHGLVSGDKFTISGVADSGGSTNIVFDGTHTATAGTTGTKIHYSVATCKTSTNGDTGATTAASVALGTVAYATYLGGNQVDEVKAIALDGVNPPNVYVTGSTNSTTGFPNGGNAIQNSGLNTTASGANTDAFIAKLNGTGSTITYSAYLGGTVDEVGTSIAVNKTCTANCEAYIAGSTTTGSGFFNTNALQGAFGGTKDGFVARVNGAGNALIYKTYFGGAGTDTITGIAATYSGTSATTNTLYLVGNTDGAIGAASSFGSAGSVTSSAFQTATIPASTGSAFVSQLSASNVANPSLGISGIKSADPIGQSTAFTSSVTYTWTITNTNAAKSVTVDIPIPQTGGADLLTLGATPITGTGSAGSCTKKVGSATAPGGLTCNLGDLTASGSTAIAVSAQPTTAAHCDNAPCVPATISQTGKAASAETGSAVSSAAVVSSVVPVTDLVITGTAQSDVTTGAVYIQGVDAALTYNITVTNNSGTTIAANSAGLDVLIESDYPTNYSVSSVTLNGNPIVLAALAQGVEGCFDDSANHKVQCNVLSIAAGGTATMNIAGAFSAAASNPTLANLITTSKFPPADTSEIFTSTGNNTNVAINVNYQGPLADLDVTVGGGLTDSPDPVRGGQTLTYTVNYQNIGTADASNVTITQSFTPGVVQTAKFSATTKPAFCTQASAGANVVCAIPDANVSGAQIGVQQSFTISGAAPLDANVATDPTFGSSVSISTAGGTSDPVGGNNTSSATTVIRREGKLSVNTLSAPATSQNGPATFQFTFNVANAGLDNATNTHVTFSLPQNVSAISISPGSCTGAATTTPDCNIGTVNAAGTVPVTVTVTPAALGAGVASANFNISITNVASAEVVDLTPGVGKTAGPVATAVQRQTTLSIAMVQNTPAAAGPISTDGSVAAGQVTYRATINNAGANTGTNVKIGFLLPTNFILKTAPANAGGTCANNAVPAPPAGFVRLECTIASIPAGNTNVDLVIAAPAALVPTNANSATMDAKAELDLSKSTEVVDSQGTVTLTSAPTVTTTVQRLGDLIIQSFSATTPVSSDGNITNQIVVSNGGTVNATSVQVVFTFDNQLRFQSFNVVNANTNTTGSLNCPAPAPAATTVTCTLPDLKPNKPYTFNIITRAESGIVQTKNPAGNSTTVQVDASISGAIIEQNAADNTTPFAGVSTPVTTVRRQADLLVISNGLTPATQTTNSGGQTTYNLTVKNNGPDADSNGHVTFSFVSTTAPTVGQPLLFTASDFTGAAGLGTCTANSPAPGQVDCVLAAPFNSLQTRSGTIKITPPALTGGQTSASFDTSAIVQSTTAFDDNAGAPGTNNTSSTVPSTVQTQSDVKVTSVVASSPTVASPITPGANIADSAALQYTVKFTNVGDPAGTGANPVVLSHTLPDETIAAAHYGYTVSTATWSSSLGTPGSCLINGGNVAAGPPVVVTCRSTSGTIPSGDVITIVEDGFANIAPTQNPPSFSFTDSVTIPVNAGYIDPTPSNNSGNAQAFQVVRTADLGVVQSGGIVVTPILPGNVLDTPGANFEVTKHIAIQYDVTVQNLSASSTVSNVVVDSVLPSTPNNTALTFTSGTNCSVFAAGPPQTVRCTVPTPLGPAGGGTDTATVSFILTPNAALPASTNVQLSFNPSVSAAGNTDTNPANNGNIPAAITIDRIADLGITINAPAVSFPTVLPGTGGAAVVFPVDAASSGNYSYTIKVSNSAGPSNANNVVVSDNLASNPVFGLAFVSGSWPAVAGTPGTPAGTCSAVGQNVTCNIGTIDAGATVPITLTVKPTLSTTTAQQAVVNNVSVASTTVADQNGSNNSDSVTVLLRGKTDLQTTIVPTPLARPGAHANLSANANPAHAIVGDQVRYDVTVTNNGPYPAGSVITLTDTIDPKVSLLSIPANQFTCSGSPVITCTLNSGTLGVSSSATAIFVTDVPASAIGAGLSTTLLNNQAVVTQYNNGSTLSQDATDLDFALAGASNNNASNNISADIAADLTVSQTAPAQVLTAAIGPPNTAAFTVTVKANQDVTTLNTTPANLVDGRSTATNVVLTNVVNITPNNSVPSITVPAGCVASAVTVLNATTDKATVTCNLNSIADNATSQVVFTMTPTKPGTITNTPSVTSSNVIEVDPNTSNNTLAAAAVTASTINVNNTPPGPQTVNPVDKSPLPNPLLDLPNPKISVFFPNVNTPGSSFVTVTAAGNSLGTVFLPATSYYNLASAAVSQTPYTVCINYNPTSFLNPERVRLVTAVNANSPIDITTSLDQVAKIVCGQVNSLPSSLNSATPFAVTEPRNTPPHNSSAAIVPTAVPSQQSSGKGVTGTSVTLSSNVVDSDINQGCYTPIGSTALTSSANLCSDVLTFTWTGQFTDGTTQTFSCPAPYTVACQTKDVSVSTTSQTLTLVVRDQTGDPVTGVFSTTVSLSAANTSGGAGSNSVTVNKGQTASFSNVLTVSNAGAATVTLAFTGTPSLTTNQITCTASPATLAGGVQNQVVNLLCSTQGQVFAMSAPPRNTGRGDAPILASMVGFSSLPLVGLLLLPGKSRRKRMLKIWTVFGLLLLMVAFQASCGGGSGSSFGGAPVLQNAGTPAGTYAVTVSPATGVTANYGTAANGAPATSLTLIVQ